MPLVANPIRYSRSTLQYDRAPPVLGANTAEVLSELGLDVADIEKLKSEGVVE